MKQCYSNTGSCSYCIFWKQLHYFRKWTYAHLFMNKCLISKTCSFFPLFPCFGFGKDCERLCKYIHLFFYVDILHHLPIKSEIFKKVFIFCSLSLAAWLVAPKILISWLYKKLSNLGTQIYSILKKYATQYCFVSILYS